MSMSREHKERLRCNRVRIVEDLELSELFYSVFRESNILTADMQEAIEAERTRMTKVGKLLDTLVRRGQNAFEMFIKALCTSNQEELAAKIDSVLCHKYCPDMENPDSDRMDETDTGFVEKTVNDIEQEFTVLVNKMTEDMKRKLSTDNNRIYAVRNPCGRALIIANVPVSKMDLGTEKDLKNLCTLFQQLGFTPDQKSNLTSAEIISTLQDEAKHKDHETASAFILCILNYGNKNNEIYDKDESPINIDWLTSLFDGHNCEKLRGKPKLFFIHTGEPGGATYTCDGPKPSVTEQDSKSDTKRDGTSVSSKSNNATVHEKADVLITLSTSDVWRESTRGSWFVRCLIYVISKHAGRHHIEDIIAKVNAVVKYQKDKGNANLQVLEKRTTLRKSFYFMP